MAEMGRYSQKMSIFVHSNRTKRKMKHVFITICLCVMACLSGYAQPKATFEQKVYEFGTILWKNPVKAVFKVKNDGNKPLVISNVTTSCGCAVADWTKEPIAPGASGVVSSTFDAKALGRFMKTVGVYCNASNKPIYLTLRGEVTADIAKAGFTHPQEIGAIRLSESTIEFDDAHKGDKPTFELLVANTSNEAYEPVLMHLPPYLKAVAEPTRIMRKGTGKIKVTLDTDKLPKFGLTTATVYLARFPGDKVGDNNAIPVSAVLLPDFSNLTQHQRLNPPVVEISDTELTIGALGAQEKKVLQVVVKNTGKSNLEITDLQVFDPSLGVQLRKRVLKPGASTKMKITVYGKYLKNLKGTPRVLMITNDPKQPKIIVKVNVAEK